MKKIIVFLIFLTCNTHTSFVSFEELEKKTAELKKDNAANMRKLIALIPPEQQERNKQQAKEDMEEIIRARNARPPEKISIPFLDNLHQAIEETKNAKKETSASLGVLCDSSQKHVNAQREITSAVNSLKEPTESLNAAFTHPAQSTSSTQNHAATQPTTATPSNNEQSLAQQITAITASDLSDAYYYISRIGGGIIMILLVKKIMDLYFLKKTSPEKNRFLASTDYFKKTTNF